MARSLRLASSRPRRRLPVSIYPLHVRRRRRRAWNAVLVAAPLAVFAAVFLWDGPPEAAGIEIKPPAAPSLPRGWDADPAAIDAQQPNIALPRGGGADAGAGLERASFSTCGGGARTTCVVDGDTFWYRGTKIRVADINAPEVSSPACASEAELGAAATRRLTALLNAGEFSLEPVERETDRYGRTLRIVTREGASLGATLVAEGLAEAWQGDRRDWC